MLYFYRYVSVLLLLVLLISCGGEQIQDKKIIPQPSANIETTKPVEILLAPNFGQDQLTSRLLGLCVQFKNLQGQDRKNIFEKLENILPKCPTITLENNNSTFDKVNAVQKMKISDLIELLGEPDNIRKGREFVYQLLEGGTYKIVFFMDEKETVACRAIEATT